jgi:hypothetical protein
MKPASHNHKDTSPKPTSVLMAKRHTSLLVAALLVVTQLPLMAGASSLEDSVSRLPDQPYPLVTEGMERTEPLIELFEPFLGTGNISSGFSIPTGAIWQPQLLVWGELRTALQSYDTSDSTETVSEWANRLDLFAQLKLSGTERVLMSVRPLDKDGQFSGEKFRPKDGTEGSVNGLNGRVRTLYFEGDFGELFPNLDPADTHRLDWGFAIGRQPVFVQEGILINDNIDAIGIVRNSIRISGASNTRVTALVGWNNVNRNNNVRDDNAALYGVFTETDWPFSTVDIDLAYVDASRSNSSGYFIGLSGVQRFGHVDTSLRYLYSNADKADTPTISTGSLVFFEISGSPVTTHNTVYFNGFWGVNNFSSAARDVDTGGPLGRTGILFAAVGLGTFAPALNNRAGDVVGGSLGYQMYFAHGRQQLILELGSRNETTGAKTASSAAGARYQLAMGRHSIFVLDGYVGDHDINGSNNGARVELRVKF